MGMKTKSQEIHETNFDSDIRHNLKLTVTSLVDIICENSSQRRKREFCIVRKNEGEK
jgi:hypothetical protein